MADYINKNEVLNLIMHNDKVCHYADERYENVVYATACRISDVVANMPAADVQSVKRGRWIEVSPKHSCCSVCDTTCLIAVYPISKGAYFCPNCGARMDGDTDNNVRNLTDEETAIYESWIESEAKDTGENIMDGEQK